jgi:hypothetical protein
MLELSPIISGFSSSPVENFSAIGGRAAVVILPAFNWRQRWLTASGGAAREALANGVSTELVNTRLGTMYGFFGRKFQTD